MIFNRIIKFIKSKITPLEYLAREAGVDIGYNNFISSPFWGTEPYLIKIGNNCQITEGVKIFTHGGAQVLRDQDPEFDTSGKVKIGDWVYIGNNSSSRLSNISFFSIGLNDFVLVLWISLFFL